MTCSMTGPSVDSRGGPSFRAWLACFSLLLVSLPFPSAADEGERFIDGLAAFDGGDMAETVRIWSDLADRGDLQASVGLAGLYLAGNGVARDPKRAAALYRFAAERGDSNGQLNLGRLYWQGLGVDRDLMAAYAWFSLAAAQGRRWAEARRLEIEPLLSAAQRREAEAMIQQIEAR